MFGHNLFFFLLQPVPGGEPRRVQLGIRGPGRRQLGGLPAHGAGAAAAG